ncbi:MAG: hypothetical protein Q8R36_01935 [bacterium]|nr:hypothetical protein [bacterium]
MNSFLDHIASPEDWKKAVKVHYEISKGFGIGYLLETRQSSSRMFIFGYCLYHTGMTLKEWAEKNGMDLHTEDKDSSERGNVINLFPSR